MGENPVKFSVLNGIATIKIDRPHRKNALSIDTVNKLSEAWDRVDSDPEIRVVVLTSADCGVFSAGMDLKEAEKIAREEGVDVLSKAKDPFHERMKNVEKPIIAAMTGSLMAGGMMLALNSDIRIGLKSTMVGITEVKIGRGSPWAAPALWMLPQALLMEIVLTGELFPIEQLHQYGFTNYLEITPEKVRERAYCVARKIISGAPLSVQAAKMSVRATMDFGCSEGFKKGLQIHQKVYASEDAIEGPKAFAQKRQPVWKGH